MTTPNPGSKIQGNGLEDSGSLRPEASEGQADAEGSRVAERELVLGPNGRIDRHAFQELAETPLPRPVDPRQIDELISAARIALAYIETQCSPEATLGAAPLHRAVWDITHGDLLWRATGEKVTREEYIEQMRAETGGAEIATEGGRNES